MAIINYSSCFLFLLSTVLIPLLLFSCLEKVEAYRFKETTAANLHQHQTHHVVSLSSLMPAAVCSTPSQGSKSSSGLLEVTHKYGPCSPMKKKNAKIPSLRQILIDDQTRVNSIHSKISNKDPLADSKVSLPANSGDSIGTGNFLVKIGLGTPKQDFTVIFDTGSELTWIQCQPCSGQCYTQEDPYFNSSASSTYSNAPCGSNACSQLQSAGYAQPSCTTNCLYESNYLDQSSTKGNFATDTLTLSSSDIFPNFEFGCGQDNKAQVLLGSADGLLGLGRSQISTISQTAQTYGKLFSYCLPPTTTSTGFLAFGKQAGGSSSTPLQYTPLLTNSNLPNFYFITMTGISVNGQSLSIPESVFTTSGTVIDSGTVISRLAATAYSALRSAFRQAMSKYPTAPPPNSLFDTCYDLSGSNTVDLPTIVLHLGGGTDLNVDKSGILFGQNSSLLCLAFAGNVDDKTVAILGNTQQQTFEVVHDVAGGKIGFGAGACGK